MKDVGREQGDGLSPREMARRSALLTSTLVRYMPGLVGRYPELGVSLRTPAGRPHQRLPQTVRHDRCSAVTPWQQRAGAGVLMHPRAVLDSIGSRRCAIDGDVVAAVGGHDRRMRHCTSMVDVRHVRSAYGAVLLVLPDPVLRRIIHGDPDARLVYAARFLGVRQLVEGLLPRRARPMLLAVDAVHAATMAGIAVVDPPRRRAALATLMTTSVLAGATLAAPTGR